MTVSSDCRHRFEPLFDIHPVTGASIEVFCADGPATFGRGGAGWFWWPRRRGFSPDGPATGPSVLYELRSVPTRDDAVKRERAQRGIDRPITLMRTQCGHGNLSKAGMPHMLLILMVPRGGIEPPTLRFSVACSTN
jgi:hypothetical protein